MIIQKAKLLCLFCLLLFGLSLSANNRDEDINKYLSQLIQENHPSGFQDNKEKVEYIFETLNYLQETKTCKDSLYRKFYNRAYYFLVGQARIFTLGLRLTNQLIKNGKCDLPYLARLYMDNGVTYEKMGNHDESIVAFNEALRLAEKGNDKSEIAKILQHINYAYWCKDLQSGIGVSENQNIVGRKILKYFEEINDLRGIQTASAELGMSATNIEDAIYYFEQALDVIRNKEDGIKSFESEKIFILIHYAGTLIRLNDTTKAFDKLQKIDTRLIGSYYDSLDYYTVLSEYEREVGQLDAANQAIDDCKLLLERLNNNDLNQLQYLRSFAKTYKVLGDYESLAKTFEQINEFIIGTRYGNKFFDTEITRFLKDLEKNEKALDQNQEQITTMNYQIWAVIGGLMLSIILLFFYRKLYQTKEESVKIIKEEQEKLVAKNAIIETKNIFLDKQKKELEAQLKTKLLMLSNKKIMLKTLTNEIDNLPVEFQKRKSLKSVILQSENKELWDRVEKEFLDTHREFTSKLLNINNKLTPNNINLCIYIKLGLSNKEIAELKFTTIESVKVAKNRLSKLLDISDNDETIYAFLRKLDLENVEANRE